MNKCQTVLAGETHLFSRINVHRLFANSLCFVAHRWAQHVFRPSAIRRNDSRRYGCRKLSSVGHNFLKIFPLCPSRLRAISVISAAAAAWFLLIPTTKNHPAAPSNFNSNFQFNVVPTRIFFALRTAKRIPIQFTLSQLWIYLVSLLCPKYSGHSLSPVHTESSPCFAQFKLDKRSCIKDAQTVMSNRNWFSFNQFQFRNNK